MMAIAFPSFRRMAVTDVVDVYGTKSGGGGCFCVRVQEGMLGYVFVVRLERIISQQIEIHAAGI